jgi:N6-adenosine-specific RNA methylase IME4
MSLQPNRGLSPHARPALLAALDALPSPAAAELEALRLSIGEQGLLQPIIVSAGPACAGEVADGQVRRIVCAELGVECLQLERPFSSELEFAVFRLSVNLKRRQLPDALRIRIGLALEPLERELARGRRAQAAGQRRGTKAVPVRRPGEKGETADRVGVSIGMSGPTFRRGAKVLQEGSPGLVAEFEAGGLSTNGAFTRLHAERRRGERDEIARRLREQPPVLPAGRVNVLAADPPWPLKCELPYPTMEVPAIGALPVPDLLTDDGVVWLWTTNSFLREALEIGAGWGLEYRTTLTWAKDRVGTGFVLRGQTEPCLVFTRGKPLFTLTVQSTLLVAAVREHSRKPDEFFALVDSLCPGSKLELFAREARPGWTAWGAEVAKFPTNGTAERE